MNMCLLPFIHLSPSTHSGYVQTHAHTVRAYIRNSLFTILSYVRVVYFQLMILALIIQSRCVCKAVAAAFFSHFFSLALVGSLRLSSLPTLSVFQSTQKAPFCVLIMHFAVHMTVRKGLMAYFGSYFRKFASSVVAISI